MKIPFQDELSKLKISSLLPAPQKKAGSGDNLPTPTGQRNALQLPPVKTPFDAYQRGKLIKLLNFGAMVPNRSVLEVGCGLGDLLIEAAKYRPKELYGVDGSEALVEQAKKYTEGIGASISVADVRALPFPDQAFDVVLVMYELQHLNNKHEMAQVIGEITRVSRQWVVLVEMTAPERMEKAADLTFHPVEYYKEKFKTEAYQENAQEAHDWVEFQVKKERKTPGGFRLRKYEHLHTKASGFIFTGGGNPLDWVRWIFSPVLYLMGFPESIMQMPNRENKSPDSEWSKKLQKWSLPMIMGLDDIFRATEGTTVMWFEREKLFGRG